MEIDFHYYATFFAAILAGFKRSQAMTIAHSAQYVDDLVGFRLATDGGNGPYRIGQFKMRQSVQDTDVRGEVIKGLFKPISWDSTTPTGWSNHSLKQFRSVWSAFHFLPAYNKAEAFRLSYGGARRHEGWTYDGQGEDEFKLICLPDSLAVKEMVNDSIKRANEAYALHLLGIRMHVMADTWAHTYYAGTPSWCINEITGDVYRDVPNAAPVLVKWGMGNEMCAPAVTNSYWGTPYLGHARMGHLPDYPFIKYNYKPQWSAIRITKDNPSDYMKAFRQMVYAMTCFRDGTTFDRNIHPRLSDESIETALKALIEKEERDADLRCAAWRAFLLPYTEAPEPHDPNAWETAFDLTAVQNRAATDYFNFCKGAKLHADFVADYVEDATGVVIDEDVKCTKLDVVVCGSNQHYVSKMRKEFSIDGTQYFPVLADAPSVEKNKFTIVLPRGKSVLKSGDTIKIITNETAVQNYDTLGYWEAEGAYYYPNMYDVPNQTWRVVLADGASGQISSGDKVRFYNIGHSKYLTYDSSAQTQYLTLTEGTPNESVWVINFVD